MICSGFPVQDKWGKCVCVEQSVCRKELVLVDLLVIEPERNWERQREINRYVVRRINSLWTVGNNGRELMVGNWRREGKGD